MIIENHLKMIKYLTAHYAGKKFYVECMPTDIGAKCFPNSNFAIKEIEFPTDEIEIDGGKGFDFMAQPNEI